MCSPTWRSSPTYTCYHPAHYTCKAGVASGRDWEKATRAVLRVLIKPLFRAARQPGGAQRAFCVRLWQILTQRSDGGPFLEAWNSLANSSLVLRCLAHGLITMTPKRDKPPVADCMRSITVLSALLQVQNMMFSTRMLECVLRRPDILDTATRAFLRESSIDDCIDTLMDVLEDRAERGVPLFEFRIDITGAYYCLQVFTLQAAFRRICFPEHAIRYFSTGILHSVRSVRTADGFSSPSRVYCGGDKHWGLRNITHIMLDTNGLPTPVGLPGGRQSRMSSVIENQRPPASTSRGYSSRTSGGQFFGASCWDFSLSKSLFAVNGVSLTTVQPLLPIRCFPNCATLLPSKPTPRRYLGAYVSSSMNTDLQIRKVGLHVVDFAARVSTDRLGLAHPRSRMISSADVPQPEQYQPCRSHFMAQDHESYCHCRPR
eukprot:g5446.t1